MPPLRSLRLALLALMLLAIPAVAQNTYTPTVPDNMLTPADPIGVPPHVSTSGTNETINLSNGALTVFVPALTLPQRSGWSITLGFFHDSNTFAIRQDLSNAGASEYGEQWGDNYTYDEWIKQVAPSWQINLPTLKSSIEYVGDIEGFNALGMQTAQSPVFCVMDFVFTDWSGNQHSFTNVAECSAMYNYWSGYNTAKSPPLSGLVKVSQSTDGSWLTLNTTTLSDIQVTTKDGTVYHFTGYQVQWPANGQSYNPGASVEQCQTGSNEFPYCGTFYSMVDTRGNTATYANGVLTDTVGRKITISSTGISYTDSNGQPDTITIGSTSTSPSTYTFPSFGCYATKGEPPPWGTVVNIHTNSYAPLPASSTTTLTFPGGRMYKLQFDQLGHLIQVTYPSGGYTQYDYQTEPYSILMGPIACQTVTLWEVKDKYECTIAAGCSGSIQTTYTPTLGSDPESPPFNSEMVETDVTTGNYTQHNFGIATNYVNYAPKETDTYYYKSGGTLLRNVHTDYIPSSCPNPDEELPGTITTTLDDIQPTISSKTVMQYESFSGDCAIIDNPTEIDQYDYDGTLKKETAQTWMTTSDGAIFGTVLDRLKLRTVTDPATSVQETLQYGYNSVADITSKTVGGTGVTALTTSYQRDGYGNITQMTDPKQSVTSFGYGESWVWFDSYCTGLNASAELTSITDALSHVTKFSYYSCTGLKQSTTDPNSQITSYTYDALGRPTKITRPDNGTTTETYVDTVPNSVTESSSITGILAKTQKTVLDGIGRTSETQLTDPNAAGRTDYVDTTYDSLGRVASVSNPYRTTSDSTYGLTYYSYDALNRTTEVEQPDGTQSEILTTYSGNFTTVTDEAGKQRKSKTDALGRLTNVWEDPNNLDLLTTYSYDAFSDLINVVQSGQRQRSFSYNGFSQLVSATNPENNTITYTYDNDGNLLTKVSYAENQNDFTPTYATGSVSISLSRYCQEGDCTSGTARITVGSYGAQVNYTINESTTSLAGALAAQLSYSSSPVTATSSGSTVLMTSKIAGPGGNYSLTTGVTGNNGIPASFVLTPSGSTLTGGSLPPTTAITYTYDKLNRALSKTYTDGTPTVTYYYDGTTPTACSAPVLSPSNSIYHRTAMCDALGWEAWAYNNPDGYLTDDRRSTSNIVHDTLYAPNLDGSVGSVQYPISGRTITYTYDAVGRPSTAKDVSNGINYGSGICSDGASGSGACYAPQGGLAYLQNGSNLYSTYIYNNRLQPCWIYATTGTALSWNSTLCGGSAGHGTIFDLKYNYINPNGGNNGNVIGITNDIDPTRSQTYSYDNLNRITMGGTAATSGTNCWGEQFVTDAWGNITSRTLPTSYSSSCAYETPFSYTIANNNQLPSGSGFAYDAVGNLTATGSANYSYNGDEMMKSVLTGGVTTTYSYDGDGQRIEKSGGTIYWYSADGQVLDETTLTGTLTNEYMFFGGKRIAHRDSSGNTFYYVEDHLGSSREIVQAGQTLACYDADFYPYGGEIHEYATICPQNYKFTGKERDAESGLDDFGARYYTSNFGRFVSADWSSDPEPVPYANPTNPQTLNLYAIVRDNPESFADLNGHFLSQSLLGTGVSGNQCGGDSNCILQQYQAQEQAEQQFEQADDAAIDAFLGLPSQAPAQQQTTSQNQLTPDQQLLSGAVAYSENTRASRAEYEAIISVIVNRADSGDTQFVGHGQTVNVENVVNARAPNGQYQFNGVNGRQFNAYSQGQANNQGARNAAAAAAEISRHGPTNQATFFIATHGRAPTQREVRNLGNVHPVGRVGNVFLYAPERP
jgi:RHS repeat-associated protein